MDVEQMFRSGKTLDEVIAEVGKIQTRVEKEKKKENNIKAAKEKLVNAYIEYAETVANRKLTDKEKDSLKKGFDFDFSIKFSDITPLDYINKVFGFWL